MCLGCLLWEMLLLVHYQPFSCSCLHAGQAQPMIAPLLTSVAGTQAQAAQNNKIISLYPHPHKLKQDDESNSNLCFFLTKHLYLDTQSNHIGKPGEGLDWVEPFECWINHFSQSINVMKLRGSPSNQRLLRPGPGAVRKCRYNI